MPIELINFEVEVGDQLGVLIKWETALENNNDYFTIEKSQDARNWEEFETVDGLGNSFSVNEYQAYDVNPYFGRSYYRLKQTDFDGQFSYSEIETIFLENQNDDISFFPNPVSKTLTVEGNKSELKNIELINSLGQNVSGFIIIEPVSDSQVKLNISALSQGIYFLKSGLSLNKVFIINPD